MLPNRFLPAQAGRNAVLQVKGTQESQVSLPKTMIAVNQPLDHNKQTSEFGL